MSEHLDPEVREILERMAERIAIGKSGASSRRVERLEGCCDIARHHYEPVIEIRSLDEFKETISKCRVVFVNAYTTYCPYCRLFHPVFKRVAERFRGKAGFIRVNLDYVVEIAYAYYIMGTPTTLVIINGKPVDRILGYVDEYDFEAYVEEILKREKCDST